MSTSSTVSAAPAPKVLTATGRARRGFAVMDPLLHKELARKGGAASVAGNKAHRWSSEEASIAGRKGGIISRKGQKKAH